MMKQTMRAYTFAIIILAAFSGLGGCAVWNFMDVRYQNATGYFNTYYNAKSLYNQALEEIDEETTPRLEATPTQQNISMNYGQSMGMSRVGNLPGGDHPPHDENAPHLQDMAGGDGVSHPNSDLIDGAVPVEYSTNDDGSVETINPGGYGAPGGYSSGGGFAARMVGGGGMMMSRAEELAARRRMMKEAGMTSSVVAKLDRVIEKCSRLLVHYPKSKWVDNALLMIGVSYFYKGDLVKSERKFKELLEGFQDSDLRAEAMLWLARVYDRMDHLEEAEEMYLKSIELAIAEEIPNIIAEGYYSLGEMYLTTQRLEKAVQAYAEGAEYASSKSNRIRLELALAREQEQAGNLEQAQKAYRNIINLDPEMELLFKAELNYARISRLRGELDNAINTLADMLDEPAYLDYDGPLQLEIGRLYEAADENEAAIEQYRYVDTTFAKTVVSAQAAFSLAQLYEHKFGNYDAAYTYYERAKLAFPGSPEANAASFRAKAFEPYFKVRDKLHDLDTLLFYVLHPDSLATRDMLQAVQDSLEREKKIAEGWDPSAKTDEQRMMERLARRRPHGRNTGRVNPWQQELDVITGKEPKSPIVDGVPLAINTGQSAQPGTGNLPLYRKLPIRAVSADSVLQAISMQRFEMGWVMFDHINNLDSSIYYYEFAIDGKIPPAFEAQAYYTLTEIYRLKENPEMVTLYEDLLLRDHPRSKYAKPILLARGMDVPKDSLTVAREAYERAAKIIEQGSYEEGIKALREMSESYAYSDQAVRAKLAIAMTYETVLDNGELAMAAYRGLVENHSDSPYAKRAHEILDAIERDKLKPVEEEKVPSEEVKTREIPKPVAKEPVLTPEQRFEAMRDSILTGKKKLKDPTEDRDFPLAPPSGSKKAPQTPPSPNNTPPESVPGNQPGTPANPGTLSRPGAVNPGTEQQPSTGEGTSQPTPNPPQPPAPETKPQ